MRHLIYELPSKGTISETLNWFRYYKFRPTDPDEFYVYSHDDFKKRPSEGDVLWFCVGTNTFVDSDPIVLGAVEINKIVDDEVNDRQEFWYVGTDIIQAPSGTTLDSETKEAIESGALWDYLTGADEGPTSSHG